MRRLLLASLVPLAACVAPQSEAPFPSQTAARQPMVVPEPPPARARWQPRAVTTDARTVAAQTYTVRSGDSLSRIAETTGSSVRAIARANGIAPPYVIRPGQRLGIPGGRYHRVNRGETGIAIALAYRVDWDSIVRANDLSAPFLLGVGQKLLLPSNAPPQRDVAAGTTRPTAESAAFDIDIDDIISGGEPAVASGEAPISEPAKAVRAAAIIPFDGRFQWPLDGKLVSSFGAKAGGLYNDGLNIAAAKGAPIRAAASGTVIYAGNGVEGWGNLVLVEHGASWVSAYAHADAFYVERGDQVNRGEVIAEVGQTGSVTSPQLHFELRQGRKAVDPRAHLPAS
ncbi:MAG: M23 family metallopeptidase [Pacificimonas sp.]